MKSKVYLSLIAFFCSVLNVFSQYGFLQMPAAGGEIQTAPTFNSCSYYYHQLNNDAFRVEYKGAGESRWLHAHTPVCDQPEKIHKGSLFNLAENTEYQIRILAGNEGKVIAQASFRTWSSAPRIARTVDLGKLPHTEQDGIVITEQGTPDAWIRYTAPADWIVKRTLRSADTQKAAIVLKDAKYIILENLTVEGGKPHAILVENCDHVRILNCDISGWGRPGVQHFPNGEYCGQYMDEDGNWIDYDGGIQIVRSFGTVVERCYVHDPRGRSNSWVFSHPTGPQAIVAEFTRGGNVIRWNDFVGSDEHRWNDVIEGIENHTADGGLFRDSDIEGNLLIFANDDGVELEGGGMNLRFIGNKIESTFCGISCGACLLGPQYAIGNLIVHLGDEENAALKYFKNSHGMRQTGKRFMYHNTLHDFNLSAIGYDTYGNRTPADAGLGTMRNNIFVQNQSRQSGEWLRAENFNNDLFWINSSQDASERLVEAFRNYGQEKDAHTADPQLVDPATGNYRPATSSPARGKAVEIAGITQAGDDLGAFFNNITDIPLRPLALTAAPAQVNFQATGGAATVTLSLPSDATEPLAFQIRQNNVFDWFTVTPSIGTIAPGETVKLTVTAPPDKIFGRPVFRGAFLVRTQNGLSRPVTVYAKGNYTEDKRPAAAGPNTVYINAVDGAADTQINIPKEGAYSLLARITPMRGANPRFDISINGETATASVGTASWYFMNGVERVVWLYAPDQLKAGMNRINIKASNPQTVVEYIITDNPAVFFVQERNVKR